MFRQARLMYRPGMEDDHGDGDCCRRKPSELSTLAEKERRSAAATLNPQL